MIDKSLLPPPAFLRSVVQLQCSKCGRETTAACDCCEPYKLQRTPSPSSPAKASHHIGRHDSERAAGESNVRCL